MPKTVTKNDISNFFKKSYGKLPIFEIKDISIPTDSLGRSRGFAYVQFSNEDMVDRIIYEKNRVEICGRLCEIKRAEMREEDLLPKAAPEPLKLKIISQKSEGNL